MMVLRRSSVFSISSFVFSVMVIGSSTKDDKGAFSPGNLVFNGPKQIAWSKLSELQS